MKKHRDRIPGGRADKDQPTDFNPKQLAMGIEIEAEHTNDPQKAMEIAMDHLKEFPDYYTRLARMERGAEKSKKESVMDLNSSLLWLEGLHEGLTEDDTSDALAQLRRDRAASPDSPTGRALSRVRLQSQGKSRTAGGPAWDKFMAKKKERAPLKTKKKTTRAGTKVPLPGMVQTSSRSYFGSVIAECRQIIFEADEKFRKKLELARVSAEKRKKGATTSPRGLAGKPRANLPRYLQRAGDRVYGQHK